VYLNGSLELGTGVKIAPGDTAIKLNFSTDPVEFFPEPSSSVMSAVGALTLLMFRKHPPRMAVAG
jgi:hypothetical protein